MNGYYSKRSHRHTPFPAIVCTILLCVCALCCIIGMSFSCRNGNFILLNKPTGAWYNSICELCVFDIGGFLIVSFCSKQTAVLLVSSAVCAIRAAAFGTAISFCTGNSAAHGTVSLIVSFGAVTILTAVYAVAVSAFIDSKPSLQLRALCYFTATGAAIILRLLPYFIINFN